MKTVNENVKEYLERLGKSIGWVAKRNGIGKGKLENFLSGEGNDEILKKWNCSLEKKKVSLKKAIIKHLEH